MWLKLRCHIVFLRASPTVDLVFTIKQSFCFSVKNISDIFVMILGWPEMCCEIGTFLVRSVHPGESSKDCLD